MGRTGAFGAFAAAAAEPAQKHNSSREVSRPSKNGTPAPPRPVPELSLAEVRALLEELRTVSSSEKFQKDLQHLRSLDWGAFKKREAVAKLLSIFWKAPLRRFGFGIDGQGFPHLLQVVKANGQRPGIRLVSHEVEKKLRMVPGTLFGLTGDVKSWKEDEVQKTDGKTHAPAVSNGKVAKDLRGRPMFLGEAKELLKAFKEALLSPAILRTMQNIEQKGGVHMDQHRRVLITQEWNPIMKRFDFPVSEAGYEAMKTGIRQFAENEYVRSSCHEVEDLCGAPPGSYFGVPTAEEMAEQKRKVEEARRAEETKKAEEEARQKKDAERRRAEEEKKRKEEEEARKREEARRQQEEAEASKKREEEEAAKRREQEETRRRKEEEEMNKQKEEEEASKKKEEEVELHKRQEEEEVELRRKQEEEEASRRKEEEEASERREQEERRKEEEDMSKQEEEEEASKKKEEEVELHRRQEEEEASRRKEEEEASARREQEEARRRKEEEEEMNKQKEEEEASKKKEEEVELHRRQEEEEASRRKEEEEASERREQEEARRRKEEEEDISKQEEEEEASKKKEEEAELHRRQEEEEASRRKEQEEASQGREQEEATEKKEPEEAATTKESDTSSMRHQEELKANLSDVAFEKMPIKEANRLNGVSKDSLNESGAMDSVGQVLEDELTGQCFEAMRRLPLLRAADATADAVGVVQASAILRGIVEGQWLRVLHSSCRTLGALADVAYLPLEELKSAESCRPFPMGTAGRFKVSAPRVAVRAHPELRGKVVGVVVIGRMLMGTPHKVAGYLWLRFEESSRKKVGEEEAWALIQGLAGEVLLEPLDADGRRVLANFQGQGSPPEMPVVDPATVTGAKMASLKPPSEKLPTPVTDPVKVSQRVDGAALARKQLKGPLEFRVLAEDHSAPVRKEPLVQSPQVGKLERGELVYGYPGGGWLQLARSDLENSWVFIGTRLSAVWAELRVTARSWNALEVTWPGLYQEKRVAYNVEWRTPEGNTKQMKGHKVSMSNKVVLGNLPSGLLCFRVGARVAGGGNNDEQDVRLWGPWTELEAGEM